MISEEEKEDFPVREENTLEGDADETDGPQQDIKAKIVLSREDFHDLIDLDLAEEPGPESPYELVAKKTISQGLMDVSLILANANQLRYNVEFNRNGPTFYVNVILLSISMTLQVIVAMVLIFKGRYYLKGQSKSPKARMVKRWCVFLVFLIGVFNVLVTAFGKIEA
ncbi:ninjurin-A-like isoform X2 [Anthonomus grandis grandis]|uniref:ninjurin-A-like isoform X2 n=1 Tax=Anthonomus grandis grandis TaxID=2921223 RepID=UPI002164F96E|nr:ninjurin-A-like isoform X2 [Anthonomus grandis grandis]